MPLLTTNTPVHEIAHTLGYASKIELRELCRSPNLEQRHLCRGRVYDYIQDLFVAEVYQKALSLPLSKNAFDHHTQECEFCFALLKPILTGALGEGQADSNQIHGMLNVLSDRLARFICKEQAMIADFINLLSAAYGLCLPVPETLIEAIDSEHRPAAILFSKLTIWGGDEQTEFFKTLSFPQDCRVKYFCTEEERQPYRAYYEEEKIHVNGEVLDTTLADGKQKGFYAYVISAEGILYTAPHIKGIFQHSTFFACGPVRCVGMLKVENGQLVDISNHSGHYRPKLQVFQEALRAILPSAYMKKTPVYPSGATIRGEMPHNAGLANSCKASNIKLLRFLGQALQSSALTNTSYRRAVAPLLVVRRIGVRIELLAASDLNSRVGQFFVEQGIDSSKLEREKIYIFLDSLSESADKLAAITMIAHFFNVPQFLYDDIRADSLGKGELDVLSFLKDIYLDLLAIAIMKIEKNNPVLHFFDEKKRDNYVLNFFPQITPKNIYSLLEGTPEEKLQTLEEAAYSILFHSDFDAEHNAFNSFFFNDEKFSALQIKEMHFIKKAMDLILTKNPELNHHGLNSLITQFAEKPVVILRQRTEANDKGKTETFGISSSVRC